MARGDCSVTGSQATAMTFMEPSAPFNLLFTTESPRNYGRLPRPGLDELYQKSLHGETPAVTYGWERSPQFVAKKIKDWSHGPTIYDNTRFTNVWLDQ